MAMEVSFRQLNGEAIILEVMPDMTGQELKEQIKERQHWDDELTRKTTRVDIVVGASRILKNDETAAGAGLSPESEATVILRQNTVTCSDKREFVRCVPELAFESSSFRAQLAQYLDSDDDEDGVVDYNFDHLDLESLFVVQITNGATAIVQNAFRCCTLLASVNIPNSVTEIGNDAFAKCSSLATVTIPDSVTEIGEAAFAGCSSLASVTIPDSVTEIGEAAFAGCNALTLVLPITRIRLGKEAFSGCQRILAKECECQTCEYMWFLNGWVCPKQRW
ncbi:Putative surface protein bspA-like (TvBspA-like-625) [Durusdinium trenchii]|uniref:Surface protein bspA-like (TvBspA-like-625) n=1 Tax=Durusdinium trenchii TaxID=1381693 RepID=A0ABP0R500_9DINO